MRCLRMMERSLSVSIAELNRKHDILWDFGNPHSETSLFLAFLISDLQLSQLWRNGGFVAWACWPKSSLLYGDKTPDGFRCLPTALGPSEVALSAFPSHRSPLPSWPPFRSFGISWCPGQSALRIAGKLISPEKQRSRDFGTRRAREIIGNVGSLATKDNLLKGDNP